MVDEVSQEQVDKEVNDIDEEEVNEQGVKKAYDVIVVGTGLVESILACALAKIGKTVLHLDRNDYYGGDYASFSLDKFIETTQSMRDAAVVSPAVDTEVTQVLSLQESSSLLRCVHSNSDFTNEPIVTRNRYEKSSDTHPACFGYTMEKSKGNGDVSSNLHPAFFGYLPHHKITKARALSMRNQFNIDLAPLLLFGSSASVDCIIHSGVVNYMEFQALDGILYYQSLRDIWSVPCSKGDVFNTKILDRLEKRLLMKFLQYVIDWGKNVIAGTDVKKLNEIELAQGRALFRPQNKQEIDQQQTVFNTPEFNNRPFSDFLTSHGITGRLQHMIAYALCMLPSLTTVPTEVGLRRLYRHMNSIGRYGDTAFLCCKYGSGELAQAYCRMCAVWGGTYILRRSLQQIITCNKVQEDVDEAVSSSHIEGVIDTAGSRINCTSLICNISYLTQIFTIRSALYTVIVLSTELMVSNDRGLVVVPPNSDEVNNEAAIFILQSNATLSVVPEGVYMYHVMMEVAMPTPITDRNEWDHYSKSEKCSNCVSVLQNLIDKLISKQGVDISRTITMKPIFESNENNNARTVQGIPLPTGMYVTGDMAWDAHMDDVVEQAKTLFYQICPNGEEFFPYSECENEEHEDDVVESQLRATLETLTTTTTTTSEQSSSDAV